MYCCHCGLEVNEGKAFENKKYIDASAAKEDDVIFGGRLGQYKYYDMDKVIEAALECVKDNL